MWDTHVLNWDRSLLKHRAHVVEGERAKAAQSIRFLKNCWVVATLDADRDTLISSSRIPKSCLTNSCLYFNHIQGKLVGICICWKSSSVTVVLVKQTRTILNGHVHKDPRMQEFCWIHPGEFGSEQCGCFSFPLVSLTVSGNWLQCSCSWFVLLQSFSENEKK